MGTDIRSITEIKRNGKWEKADFTPFDWRNYSIFAFLADVRNYDHCECITRESRGLPDDSEYLNELVDDDNWFTYGTQTDIPQVPRKNEILDGNYSTQNHMTLKELLDWDYDKKFENRRTFKATYRADGSISGGNGAHIADVGEGTVMTYRESLGEGFFNQLEILKSLGEPDNVRIIVMFD